MDNNLILSSKMLHDINNKLTSILGYSEILCDEDSLSAEQIAMAKSITSAALNLRTWLNVTPQKTSEINHPSIELNTTKRKVLVVDDNEDNRTILEHILKKYPLEIFTAQNGLESIKIAEEKKPDLIFMDLNMPDINGIEASTAIKQNSKHSKIIALTGDARGIEKEMQNSELFDLCLLKPFDRNQVKNIIETLIQEEVETINTDHKLSRSYLLELNECAKMGRVTCLEDLIKQCDDEVFTKLLEEKISLFNFDEIVVWTQRLLDDDATE